MSKCGCDEFRQVGNKCEKCAKNKQYKLLKTGMVGGPSIVFTRYHEAGKSRIRDHQYYDAKICAGVMEFDTNSLHLYCSSQECLVARSNTLRQAPLIWKS